MAELATIARPYAEALFRVAKAGSLAAWSDLVTEMAQVAAHPELKALAQNPSVSHAKLAEVFAAAVKTPLSVEAQNFVKTLADNGRLTLLPQIAEQFHALKNAQEGSADAHIVSAFEMSDAQVKDVIATLEKKFGRKLNPSVEVDSSLIGGVRVVVGDEVFDTSVRAKLQQLHVALAA
ncbi:MULTISPECIES: F0F1 ATP synthase subunit delta [unclassified Herbaspirillum]|uniref:F0F1 ATP synthase subunit delta n=1 Tax=unclassified Herbaspirillum TaxID=2624150 RepID=UPI00114FD3A9|nr:MULTISPECIES: F0F1 ATP synthase subunit delta [unclassified Herbaspirillum]MBB5390130.1 F-type H+-transporting ATPase subunit delta [Herbaspirillum sp. SJZ102]TQK09371.1 ATP synthase F1 subcomplex delta subunit [Herbaspirillum sp. SJZ130]TQK13942.1 ATP synthase F1 subcomplex delta subunit [Herbaspirillum sp. SJZ106]TWC69667.1 ATP synthase F1 subcomplex delta subunit [Herbaspirillum sp. SJZ099]